MNILVVHETEYIEKVIYEYQIIPETLASRGHKVYVIDYPDKWKKKNFFDFGSFRTQYLRDVKKAGKKKGITLIRPGVIKIPVLSRFLAFFSYWFLIGKIIKKYKINKIILYSAPTNGLQTIYFAKKYKIPVHFRLLDVLHQLVPYKILSFPTYLIEKSIYKRVNEITAITPKLTQYAVEMGGNSETTSYLPSGADLDMFYPASKDKTFLDKYDLKNKDKILLFAGTLYNFSGLDILLNYFAKNIKKYPNLKFLIVGDGQQRKILEKIIREGNLEKQVILTGFVNYEELFKYINLADITINPFEINPITDIIFPGKIYQYQACGKPVIATRLKGVIELFPDDGGKSNIYYFNLNRPAEFFKIVSKIKNRKVKDPNLSLEQITSVIEKSLCEL